MPNYRRVWAAGGTFFFTVTLEDRESALLTTHIAALKAAISEAKQARPFRLDAIVVLPEHLHCIWTLPPGDNDFATRWRHLKGCFSARLEREETTTSSRRLRRERGIWQRRFWEHAIREETDYQAHLTYIHYNPVKHGHVTAVRDWPYSSFHRFVRNGVYPENWASDEPRTGGFGER